jgi:hypothetical protein
MIRSQSLPKILFIKDVFKYHCINDDIFEQKILENSNIVDMSQSNEQILEYSNNNINNNYVVYDKLPTTFEDIKTWPKKTNLVCWNCHLAFEDIPVFIPNVLEPVSNKKLYRNSDKHPISIGVTGVFCAFGCAMNYVETRHYSMVTKTEAICKLKMLHKLFYGKPMKDISHYPPPSLMTRYGGSLSVEEYIEEKKKYRKENI